MEFFLALFIAFILIVAAVLLVALYYLRKGYRFIKRMTNGEMTEEEFERLSKKNYRRRDQDNLKFDKDYFKGTSSKGSRRPESNSSYRTTTTTAEGVTIIDDRPQQERQKIFEAGEGEYVDYEVVEN